MDRTTRTIIVRTSRQLKDGGLFLGKQGDAVFARITAALMAPRWETIR